MITKPNPVKTILRDAIGVMEKNRFTQRTMARNGRGYPVKPTNKNATSFCMMGAIMKTPRPSNSYWNDAENAAFKAMRKILDPAGVGGSVGHYNDKKGFTKKKALATLRAAHANQPETITT